MENDEMRVDNKALVYKINKKNIILIVGAIWSTFHLYTGFFGLLPAYSQRGIHLIFALLLTFLVLPFNKKHKDNSVLKFINLIIIFLTLVTGLLSFIFMLPSALMTRIITGPSTYELIIAGIIVIFILEATRRTSFPLLVVALCSLLYALFGPHMPGMLMHRGYTIKQILDMEFFSTEGIFGTPLAVSASYIILFILLGSFLEKSGAGKFFVNLAFAATGRVRSGPAMSAVLASALMGTINGSTVANVVTTGSFTIPLMKRVGFRPVFAGAVESVASSGGQFMPPVMGAAAFIMAEMLGISYSKVAIAAAIPAVLYFLAAGMMIHLEACKMGLQGLSRKELPNVKDTLAEGFHFIVPIFTLVYLLLVLQWTPTKSACWTIAIMVAVTLIRKVGRSNMGPKNIIAALADGAKNALQVSIACAAAGIIIGVITLTGLGLKFSYLVISLANGNLLLGLILTMVACIILGMGVPTAAAYIITASLGVPALVQLGVEPIAGHMFCLYFACISSITPPVALAAYAGASVAGSDPMKTAFHATRLGISGFIVPYLFVYGNELLLIGTTGNIILAFFTALFGVYFLSVGMQGYFVNKVNPLLRIILVGSALGLMKPGLTTDFVGISLGIVVLAALFILNKKKGLTKIKGVETSE